MVWWLEKEGKRGRRRDREGGKEESALLQFVLYKSEVVFLSPEINIISTQAKHIALMSRNETEVGNAIAFKNSGEWQGAPLSRPDKVQIVPAHHSEES